MGKTCDKKRNDVCIACEAIRLSIEIRNNDGKNIIFNIVHRPPDGDLEVCLRKLFSKHSFT